MISQMMLAISMMCATAVSLAGLASHNDGTFLVGTVWMLILFLAATTQGKPKERS